MITRMRGLGRKGGVSGEHERIVDFVCSAAGASKFGFRRSVLGHLDRCPHYCRDSDTEGGTYEGWISQSLRGVRPDAFRIEFDIGLVLVYEVETTCALTVPRLQRYAEIADALDMTNWQLVVQEIDGALDGAYVTGHGLMHALIYKTRGVPSVESVAVPGFYCPMLSSAVDEVHSQGAAVIGSN